jgi:hypothetical protein
MLPTPAIVQISNSGYITHKFAIPMHLGMLYHIAIDGNWSHDIVDLPFNLYPTELLSIVALLYSICLNYLLNYPLQ